MNVTALAGAPGATAAPTFQFTPVTGSGKEVYCVFGNKGEGKTFLAFGFPGKKYVLSFDRKSQRIKDALMLPDSECVVLDAIQHYQKDKVRLTESASVTFDYIVFLLREVQKRGDCDWLIIDGLEILMEICEMKMRLDNKMGPFQGIANFGIWKDRKLNVRGIHDECIDAAKKGVIYTTYTEKDKIVEDGQLIRSKDAPKWTDVVMYETDVVLNVYTILVNNQIRIHCDVTTSKIQKYKTGMTYNITGTTLDDATKDEKRIVRV